MRTTLALSFALAFVLAFGAVHDAQAASRKSASHQALETRNVAASSWAQSRSQVYRDIARYDSAPLISGGGY